MSLITPDFSDTQDSVEAGIYKVRVTDAKVDEWQGKDGKPNTPFINWTLETFDEENSKNNGRKVWHKTPFAGPGAFRFKEFFKAATGDEYPEGEGFDPEQLFGKEMEVTVVDGINRQTKEPTGYTEVKLCKPIN